MSDEIPSGYNDIDETIEQHLQDTADLGPGNVPSNTPLDVEPVVDLATPDTATGRIPQSMPAMSQPLDIQQVPDQETPALQPMQAPIAAQATNPVMGGMNDAYAQAFAQKESGIKDVAAAQSQAAKSQAAAYAAQADQIAKQQAHYEQEHAKLDVEHKQLVDAMMNDKIDANRLYHNMGTGNKILAAVSVALSGLGSGLSGQPNMAMGVIQKSIDRDIEAQRMELGKKNTLLSENVRRYGDLNTATQATMLQMNAMTQAKVSQAAAQSGSAQAQANAKVMLGDLGLQAAQLKQQMAIKNMAMQGGSYDPSVLVPSLVKDPGERKVVFNEIKQAQNTKTAEKEVMAAFDLAKKENTALKTGANPFGQIRTPGSILKMRAMMLPIIHDAEGRVNEFEQKTTSDLEPKPGDTDSKIAEKRQALMAFLNQKKSAPTAKGYGIDLDKFGSTTTQSGPEIKTMGGVQYKKVSGGWQKI